jgi:hypothetical protein
VPAGDGDAADPQSAASELAATIAIAIQVLNAVMSGFLPAAEDGVDELVQCRVRVGHAGDEQDGQDLVAGVFHPPDKRMK